VEHFDCCDAMKSQIEGLVMNKNLIDWWFDTKITDGVQLPLSLWKEHTNIFPSQSEHENR